MQKDIKTLKVMKLTDTMINSAINGIIERWHKDKTYKINKN